MENKFLLKVFITVVLVFMVVCSTACAATFSGKVIDADTKEPIEGAVVVALWVEKRATAAGATSRGHEVKEALTDKNGEWKIKGPSGGELGNIKSAISFVTGIYFTDTPEFIVFKPGYCSLPLGFGIDGCKDKMRKSFKGIGKGETVELPKALDKETRLRCQDIFIYGLEEIKDGEKKVINFLLLQNEERRNLGLQGNPILKEKGYEK